MAKSAVAKAACTPRARQVKKSRQLKAQPSSEEVQAAAQTKADAVFMKGCAKAKKRLDAQADKLKLSVRKCLRDNFKDLTDEEKFHVRRISDNKTLEQAV